MFKKVVKFIKKLLENIFFKRNWRCICCGKELFSEGDFCEECLEKLPFIGGIFCDHCGRKIIDYETYCSTCKNNLTAFDKGRSVFTYSSPIDSLIKQAKYDGKRYILQTFAKYMFFEYAKNFVNADIIAFIPMSKKARKERGYNQGEILAIELSKLIKIPVYFGASKIKETIHQAQLNREERSKNLHGVFRINNKKLIKNKKILLVDDVTTTGATAQVFSAKLKSAGASYVFLLTIASVSPKDGY